MIETEVNYVYTCDYCGKIFNNNQPIKNIDKFIRKMIITKKDGNVYLCEEICEECNRKIVELFVENDMLCLGRIKSRSDEYYDDNKIRSPIDPAVNIQEPH